MQPPGVLHTDPLVVLIAQRNWYSYAVKALSQTTRDSSIRKSIAKLEMIYSKHWRVKDWRHEIKLRGFYNAQHFRDTCGKEMILEAIGGVEP
ncbi:hypothetical protein ATW55_15470 [Ferroacidibacillus organovorans]|uniref:Uncharacterized protein n=1 Tax=Ferroacidibacillus organovorans TaxID=1765683 RepID=A0A117SX88_9BACL|nr:hypothetical protein ATW55_15470 [Ferroacidibacillus organovorans]